MKKIISISAIAGLLCVAGANGQTEILLNGNFDGETPWINGGFGPDGSLNDRRTFTWDDNVGVNAYSNFSQDIDISSYTAGTVFELNGQYRYVDFGNLSAGVGEAFTKIAITNSSFVELTAVENAHTVIDAANPDIDLFTNMPSVSYTLTQANIDAGATYLKVLGFFNVTTVATVAVPGTDGFVSMDNFSLTAVPEPSTYAMIAGFLAFGFVAVRRRMAAK